MKLFHLSFRKNVFSILIETLYVKNVIKKNLFEHIYRPGNTRSDALYVVVQHVMYRRPKCIITIEVLCKNARLASRTL